MKLFGPPRAWREAPFGARVIALMITGVAVLVILGVGLALIALLILNIKVADARDAEQRVPVSGVEPLLNRVPH